MGKAPLSKAGKETGQKDLGNFFTVNNKAPKKQTKPAKQDEDEDYAEPASPASDEGSELEMDVVSEEEEELVKPKRATKSKSAKKPARKAGVTLGDDEERGELDGKSWQANLPPIHDISEIFADIVRREPRLKDVAERVRGRKLRVATMCSGTESPLLALDMMCHLVAEQYGTPLEVEHVFSCEIEPFKQAYIERNFHPPLLFRDVCELGQSHATTAYGASAPVPGNVDLLVAGTSCVDYSNLNNEKQTIESNGESGRTFRGMLSWVTNHKPPLVILENVYGAPWKDVCRYFEDVGYSAQFCHLDTKRYYIPHTRQRGYLLAVNKDKSRIPEKWKDLVGDLARPASSTLDAFLLPTDDPRIHLAREKLARGSENASETRSGRLDWTKCQQRHERERDTGELGQKRPLTHWEEGGTCKLNDHAWQDWAAGQVERVWDSMDITMLKAAKEGYDPSYKTQVWNLSQNVDRNIAAKLGLCPCLTPSMIPYITNRGGPMIGLEALSMQGLPIDRLLLTRESEDNLADLAGNAMSTTVVGTSILAALVVGLNLMRSGSDKETYEEKDSSRTEIVEVEVEAMDVDKAPESILAPVDRIIGEEDLVTKPLQQASSGNLSLSEILEQATRSVRMCECEGRTGVTDRPIDQCRGCGSSTCVRCGGRPEHDMERLSFDSSPRLLPSDFVTMIKAALPMCLRLDFLNGAYLDELKDSTKSEIPDKRWIKWRDAVVRASRDELPFVELKRQEIWSAVYESNTARIELSLHPLRPEWQIFAKPDPSEPALADIRVTLSKPVARLICRDDLLTGDVEIGLPIVRAAQIKIEGEGDLVPSWQSRLGLEGEEFKEQKVHSALRVTLDESDTSLVERNINGKYILLDKCGTANSALHKRIPEPNEEHLPPLFLLLDPARTGPPTADFFVISTSRRRYQYAETRPIIASLSPSWRPSSNEDAEDITCEIPSLWVPAQGIGLKASIPQDATFSSPKEHLNVQVSQDTCQTALAILQCKVRLPEHMQDVWPQSAWNEVDKIHERETLRKLAWLFESIPSVADHFRDWQQINDLAGSHTCARCAPPEPSLLWAMGKKRKIVAIENTVEAGEYERRLKNRPAPFITQLKLQDNIGTMRIGINLASLAHRALSRLPSRVEAGELRLSWRLDTRFVPQAAPKANKFRLISNRNDPSNEQPPNFKLDLRPEQLRSLHWMIHQESKDVERFVEEEISEATLEALGWRVETRAERDVCVRGGVLADQVGYGKTAITLGVIDSTRDEVRREFKDRTMDGKIPTKASLVIVPPHLTKQWPSEVKKFVKGNYTLVQISTQTNLNTTSIADIMKADIVFVASNLYQSQVYLENLVAVAGGGELPNTEGRYFSARLDAVLESLTQQVDRLRNDGPKAMMKEIIAGRARWEERKATRDVGTTRLKGKRYRDAQETVEDNAPTEKPVKQEESKPKSEKGRSSRQVEVIIPPFFKTPPSGSSSGSDMDDVKEAPARNKRATTSRPMRKSAAAKKVIEISDEDMDEAKDGSDYHATPPPTEPEETTSDEDESAADSVSEVETRKKPRAATKQAPKKSRKRVVSDDEDDDASSDGPITTKKRKAPSAPTKATKRSKVSNDKPKKEVKAKPHRELSDPWKLKDGRREWDEMLCPPLEMFHFARVVIDEYTYLSGRALSMINKISADRHWVLSGTPPTHNFAAVKSIAQFLNLHLGVDDDGDGHEKSQEIKKRRTEQTAVEKFHSFREVHTSEWHDHRHHVGQRFLNQFVRQNIAEIDEIPTSEHIVKVELPAAERAIYLELEHHLRALDMTIKRSKKSGGDREKRLQQSMGDSASAEEALLKRCSHFDLDHKDHENAMSSCQLIVKDREAQLKECKTELLKVLKEAAVLDKKLERSVAEESHYPEYVRGCVGGQVGDDDAKKMVLELFEQAGVKMDKSSQAGPAPAQAKAKGKGLKPSADVEERKWTLREKTHTLRRLTKELTGRVRSLRYFTVVRDLQKQSKEPRVYSCSGCGKTEVPLNQLAVLSSCGHVGCEACVMAAADREQCVEAGDGGTGCRAQARRLYVVRGDTLGVDEEHDGKGRRFGKKLEVMIDMIKNKVPKDERILIFVQFPDLMQKVNQTLSAHKLGFLEIKGTAHTKSTALQKFQDGNERILLLNVMDESASGANLTSANHAFFLSPLLAPSQEIYDACETQAIGRLRRFGQRQHVHVYRFLTQDTIDEQIHNDRVVVPRSKMNI